MLNEMVVEKALLVNIYVLIWPEISSKRISITT